LSRDLRLLVYSEFVPHFVPYRVPTGTQQILTPPRSERM